MPEVLHLVALAQHPSELHRVAVYLAIRYTIAVCDAIAHTSHFNLPKGLGGNE